MNNQMRTIVRAAAAFAAIGFAASSGADEIAAPTEDTGRLTIGVIGAYMDKPIRDLDDDAKAVVAPLIVYEGKHFFFRATSFGWKFIDREDVEFAVIAEGRFAESWDSSDSDFLSGMDDRDPTLDLGIQVTVFEGNFGGRMTAVGDITNEHEGFELRGEGFYQARMGKWLPRFSVGIVWQNEDLVDYYYRVRPSEVIPGVRPFYAPDATVNFRFQAVTAYALRPNFTVLMGARAELLGSEIDDSPITDDNKRYTFLAALGYTF
jgi:outer membrane protein